MIYRQVIEIPKGRCQNQNRNLVGIERTLKALKLNSSLKRKQNSAY